MTLETFVDQTLTQADATLHFAQAIRATLQAPEQLWRPFRFTARPFPTT